MNSREAKVALITGAANGIGRATALAFAAEGANCMLVDIEKEPLARLRDELRERKVAAQVFEADVSNEDDCRAMVQTTRLEFGRLDFAVNNAGISGGGPDRGLTADYETNVWHRVIAINLTGVFMCIKHEIPLMLAGGGGAIVNTSSIMGFLGCAGISAYSAAKHGVLGLTKTVADEYGARNIRCNAVAPGMVRTRLTSPRFDADAELMESALGAIPQARFAEPEEIAKAIVWLSGPGASYVNGTCLAVDGGYLARS